MALNEDYLQIGYDIIGAAYEVRNTTGRQFREIYYKRALSWELRQKGYVVENEVLIPALYKGIEIDDAYKADIVVVHRVVIEVKALGKMGEAEMRQLLTYMQLSDFRLGYLINFGAKTFKTGRLDEPLPYDMGIYRVANKL